MAASLQVTPSPVPFGLIRNGSVSQPKTVNLKNIGDVDLVISSFLVTGPYAVTGFAVPVTLGPGASINITVSFSPTVLGAQNGTLSITSNDPGSPTLTSLTGTGVTGANLDQVRQTEFVDALISRFDVTSTLTAPGPLPHTYVFVMKVNDRINAKADVLSRVSRITDLTTLPQGRDAALLANPVGVGFEFITPTVMVSYPDLATAKSGAQAIKDRVNNLIAQWTDYSAQFQANPEHIPLPTSDLLAKNALIATYSLAKKTRRASQDARDVAKTALDTANTSLTDISAQVNQIQKFYQDLTTLDGAVTRTAEMQNAATAFQVLATASGVALPNIPAGGAYNTFAAAIAQANLDIAAANQGVTNHGTYATSIQTYLTSRQAAKTAATNLVNTATTAYTQALQNFTNATAAEAAALSAVLKVAPDFDPTTICEC